MNHRIPKRYILLLSCTGKEPLTLSFHPAVVLTTLALLVTLPTVWIGGIVYSYARQNSELTERNTQLSEKASDILEQIEALESEIDHLQERAGMSQERSSLTEQSFNSQGGIELEVEPELLLEAADGQIPTLVEALKSRVRPALEETLVREEARPRGIPLKVNTEITSEFGLRRNPFGRNYEFHSGIDFKGSIGTPIHVTAPGTVEKAEWDPGYGNHVIINHGYGYRTLYAHLSEIEVARGMQLDRDRIVGFVGNTGRSSGPHLHYSVYRHGEAIDPQGYLD